MHCFCLTYYQENGEVAGTMDLMIEVDPTLPENPCEEWLWIYQNSFYLTLASGILVGAINGIVCAIF